MCRFHVVTNLLDRVVVLNAHVEVIKSFFFLLFIVQKYE